MCLGWPRLRGSLESKNEETRRHPVRTKALIEHLVLVGLGRASKCRICEHGCPRMSSRTSCQKSGIDTLEDRDLTKTAKAEESGFQITSTLVPWALSDDLRRRHLEIMTEG